MNRRTFLTSTAATGVASLLGGFAKVEAAAAAGEDHALASTRRRT